MTATVESTCVLEKALDTWLATSSDLVFIKDTNLVYLGASLSFAQMVGRSSGDDLVGKTDFEIFPMQLAVKYTTDDRRVLDNNMSMVEYVEPLPSDNGHQRYSSTSKYVVRDNDGNRIGLLGVARDVTAQIELAAERNHSAELRVRAETDALTGLFNRDSIMNHIRDCVEGYGIHSHHAILFIDLDCFKQVNDTLGHPFGDKILTEIAHKLMMMVRGSDLVGRIGGDEFMILLRDVFSIDVIRSKAEEICRAVPIQITEDGQEFEITCSIGIAVYDGDGRSLEMLYEEADRAMYRAKQLGRNSVSFCK